MHFSILQFPGVIVLMLATILVPVATLTRGWLGSSSKPFGISFKDSFLELRYGWVAYLTVIPALLLCSLTTTWWIMYLVGMPLSGLVSAFYVQTDTYKKQNWCNPGQSGADHFAVSLYASWIGLFFNLVCLFKVVNAKDKKFKEELLLLLTEKS